MYATMNSESPTPTLTATATHTAAILKFAFPDLQILITIKLRS